MRTVQAPSAPGEDEAAVLHRFCWPDGEDKKGASGRSTNGRTWAHWEQAVDEITALLLKVGFPSVRQHKQGTWELLKSDPPGTAKLLKKLVFPCPHGGKYAGVVDFTDVQVEGGRKTTTTKTDCPMKINVKVERTGTFTHSLLWSKRQSFSGGGVRRFHSVVI
jgi:hypothetical protein